MESNRLPPSPETCEQCHDREKFIGSRLRILTEYNNDELNTRAQTVLMMMVGGGKYGGIHGIHMGPGVHIRYIAADKQRQTIPWVEYRVTGTSGVRTVEEKSPEILKTLGVPNRSSININTE